MFPSQQQPIDQSSTESFRFRTFHFPKEKVLQLKAKANAEMGLRQRLKPPLPNEYFGNALQAGIAVKSTAENFVKSPTSLYPIDIVQTRSTPVLLIAGSSHRFNVYGNGFGWGRPLCVRDGPAGKKKGMLKVYPGDEEGKIDFTVCLLHEILQALAGDAEFMDALL
ncbi:hypothetical protein ACLB2K_005994 [Fragaria x ananassa]